MKKRYVICGVSCRALLMYITPMTKEFAHCTEIVGMLDIDPLRFKICKEDHPELEACPTYMPEEFDKMISETRPDAVIVTSIDRTHKNYVVQALKYDLEVICEKPMTTNTADALEIRAAEKASKGRVLCTFNYRYNPVHRKLKEMVLDGKIGRVTHVDLNWYIDIQHGSSYFNRWNRMRENSGSLSIHKASHHFDLVNWWVDGVPTHVHAFGALNHYGPDAVFNPSKKEGRHCTECTEKMNCAYKRRWTSRSKEDRIQDDHISAFQTTRKLFTDYRPDMCIFDSEINIHDTIVANVKYRNGVLLNYSANFSTPFEGYRLAINGTHGRLESMEFGGNGGYALPDMYEEGNQYIDYFPIFEGRERIHVIRKGGAHGGGDPLLQEDLFLGEDPLRKFDILARSVDGLRSISIGDAVYNSIMDGEVKDLTSFME